MQDLFAVARGVREELAPAVAEDDEPDHVGHDAEVEQEEDGAALRADPASRPPGPVLCADDVVSHRRDELEQHRHEDHQPADGHVEYHGVGILVALARAAEAAVLDDVGEESEDEDGHAKGGDEGDLSLGSRVLFRSEKRGPVQESLL